MNGGEEVDANANRYRLMCSTYVQHVLYINGEPSCRASVAHMVRRSCRERERVPACVRARFPILLMCRPIYRRQCHLAEYTPKLVPCIEVKRTSLCFQKRIWQGVQQEVVATWRRRRRRKSNPERNLPWCCGSASASHCKVTCHRWFESYTFHLHLFFFFLLHQYARLRCINTMCVIAPVKNLHKDPIRPINRAACQCAAPCHHTWSQKQVWFWPAPLGFSTGI